MRKATLKIAFANVVPHEGVSVIVDGVSRRAWSSVVGPVETQVPIGSVVEVQAHAPSYESVSLNVEIDPDASEIGVVVTLKEVAEPRLFGLVRSQIPGEIGFVSAREFRWGEPWRPVVKLSYSSQASRSELVVDGHGDVWGLHEGPGTGPGGYRRWGIIARKEFVRVLALREETLAHDQPRYDRPLERLDYGSGALHVYSSRPGVASERAIAGDNERGVWHEDCRACVALTGWVLALSGAYRSGESR